MIRADDTTEDFLFAIAAVMFYTLSVLFILVAIGSKIYEVLWVSLFAACAGGVFHFIKVSSDGRVRNQRAEYVRRAERERINPSEGSC